MKRFHFDRIKAFNWILKITAIALTLCIVTLMVCNAPIVEYTSSDGTQNVSILTYLKKWQPLVAQEGTLAKTDNSSLSLNLNLSSDVDPDADDGLDLDQIIEGQYTILFLGFDSEENGSGDLHDVNYLIQFDLFAGTMNILQIPRDSYMPNYTRSSTNKFNSIYTLGDSSVSNIQRVVDAVQESFGIPIDAYVTTTCDNIVDIVDIIGGIPINMPYTIVYETGKVIYQGEQTLNGTQSEWFVRYRKGYDEGDIGRVKAQRIFLAAAMHKVIDMGTVSLMSALTKIYNQELLYTDLSIEQISMLADFAGTLDMDSVSVFMVPGEGATANGQSIWSIHKSAALEIINTYFRPYQDDLEYDDSTIVEWVSEGNYLSTDNDDTAQSLGEIYGDDT